MSSPQQLILPDLVAMCPWTSSMNPHYDTAGPESAAWIDSFNIFQSSKRASFRAAAAELCAARTYPYAGYEEYRTACDFLNLLFVADEVTDEQGHIDASKTGEIFLCAMKGELEDSSAVVHLTRQWKERFDKKQLPNSNRRFLKLFANYLDGVAREAGLREQSRTLSVSDYTILRREFSGTQTVFAIFEYILGIDLPDAVFDDPIFKNVYWAAVDMIDFSNDLYSYRVEREKGLEDNNLLTVYMRTEGLTLQQAADKAGDQFQKLVDNFERNKSQLPSFTSAPGGYDKIDEDVKKYVTSMEQWVIGSIVWSFETPRYFGSEKEEVLRTLVVYLRDPADFSYGDDE